MHVSRHLPRLATLVLGVGITALGAPRAAAQANVRGPARAAGDSVTIRIRDLDLRLALQSLATYLDRPLLIGNVPPVRVTLETPTPVPRSVVPGYVRGLLRGYNLLLVDDSTGIYRVESAEMRPVAMPPAPAPALAAPPAVYAIRLQHARAADVAMIVNALYGRTTVGYAAPSRYSTLPQQLQQQLVPPQLPGAAGGGSVPMTGLGGAPSPSGGLSADAVIVPDPAANTLLVRASPTDFELVRTAVAHLDVRPLQVLIEVLIAEVRRDRSLSVGVDTKLPATGIGPGGATADGRVTGLGLGDFALHVMNLGPNALDVTLRASASRGDVRVLSRPVVVAANNEEAQILVGSQRPFVQVSRSLPTDIPSRDQVIQYRDVGTKLTVRPTINTDGGVMLEIAQEVNQATSETAFEAPVISTRTVQTRLLVKDGQTVVLGGLTDREREVRSGGVPFLSSIPGLGALFGRVSRQTAETELLLFLTPHVLRSDGDAETLSKPLRRRAEEIRP